MAYSYTVKTSMNGRVLIADDDLAFREVISIALEELGLTVEHAGTGDEALQRVREKKYSLVITDIQMPEVDGLTFLKKMQGVVKNGPPVILITSNTDWLPSESVAGVKAIFAKPFGATAFLKSVRDIIEHGNS